MITTFLFPGQGSQYVGMGKEFYTSFQEAKDVFEEIDEVLQQKLSKIIFEGPAEDLTMTSNAQPAIMAVSMAIIRVLEKQGGVNLFQQVAASAGHSLGEYSALTFAKAFNLSDTAMLLRIRGDSMQSSVPLGEGGMVALLGAPLQEAEKIVGLAAKYGVCEIANDNGAEQIVLSGAMKAMEFVLDHYKDFNIKKAVKLPVSAPFHSTLMQKAEYAMKIALANVTIRLPQLPVISNVSVLKYLSAEQIRQNLEAQICSRVRWRETMLKLAADFEGSKVRFVEIGPGKVLSTLAHKMLPECESFSIACPKDLDKFLI